MVMMMTVMVIRVSYHWELTNQAYRHIISFHSHNSFMRKKKYYYPHLGMRKLNFKEVK